VTAWMSMARMSAKPNPDVEANSSPISVPRSVKRGADPNAGDDFRKRGRRHHRQCRRHWGEAEHARRASIDRRHVAHAFIVR